MTPNQLTDLIALELGVVNDFPFKRAMLARANAVREQQMKRALDKVPQDRKFFTQSVRVPMHNVDMLSGTGLSQIYSRNKCAVPRVLRANSTLYDYVGALDGSNAYRYTPTGHSIYLQAGKYGHKEIHYYREGNDILVQRPGVPEILIVSIFADPEEAFNLDARTCACDDCDFWEEPYPCSGDIIDIIIQEITGKWKVKPVNTEVNGTQNQPNPTT
jgi:hypothetical protein